MTILVLLIFLFLWAAVFWVGSIFLEATGMERSKARFQALSCLSGTGFTTQESELVINQPRRRHIAYWLMVSGLTSLLVLVVIASFFIIYGFEAPAWQTGVFAGAAILMAILVKAGCFKKLTSKIIGLFKQRQDSPYSLAGGILHEKSGCGVVRIWLSTQAKAINMSIRDTGFDRAGITILAIERGDRVITFPDISEFLQPGDYLLCYGKIPEITRAAGVNQF